MPQRVIREGWLDSPTIAHLHASAAAVSVSANLEPRELAWLCEILLLRLTLAADDHGRMDGRIATIAAKCWPEAGPGEPSPVELLDALQVLQRPCPKNGKRLVVPYEIDGKPYLWIPNLRARVRAPSRFPAPPDQLQAAVMQAYSPMSDTMSDTMSDMMSDTMSDTRPPYRNRARAPTRERTTRARSRPLQPVVKYINTVEVDKRQAETARPVDKSPAVIAEKPAPGSGEKPVDKSPPPPQTVASVTATAPQAPDDGTHVPAIPAPSAKRIPPEWASTTQGIEQAGQLLDMPRIAGESDSAYAKRIGARIALETA